MFEKKKEDAKQENPGIETIDPEDVIDAEESVLRKVLKWTARGLAVGTACVVSFLAGRWSVGGDDDDDEEAKLTDGGTDSTETTTEE